MGFELGLWAHIHDFITTLFGFPRTAIEVQLYFIALGLPCRSLNPLLYYLIWSYVVSFFQLNSAQVLCTEFAVCMSPYPLKCNKIAKYPYLLPISSIFMDVPKGECDESPHVVYLVFFFCVGTHLLQLFNIINANGQCLIFCSDRKIKTISERQIYPPAKLLYVINRIS